MPPAVKVSEVGERLSEKSGGAETVRATVAVWLSVPDVPVKVIVVAPAAAFDAAVSVKLWDLAGVRLKVAGAIVTPEGSPAAVSETVPAKLLTAVAVTLMTRPVAPGVNAAVAGETIKEKSGAGSMDGELPPHDKIARQKNEPQIAAAV